MKPKIYTADDHHIRNNLIDHNALYVLSKLREEGYTAYLVGGGVRDLLMRHKPKDFDISTSALPEEIKSLFRRCILVGRRFRLAHVRFGKQVIEVSTFRAAGEAQEEELIIRDNIWGTPEEDVLRRDFTINGLFYDPLDHKIIDYVGGFEDLKKHYLKVIGNPMVRFKQDPVRMIRMQKFRARFGFNVQPEALEALENCWPEIEKSSPARVFEEIFRMLESGASASFFELLVESKLLDKLFPKLVHFFHQEVGTHMYAYLKGADSMNTRGRYQKLDRSVLTAALLFPILEEKVNQRWKEENKPPLMGDIMEISSELIHELLFEAYSHFPRKIRQGCHFILNMQFRLTPLEKKRHPRKRIANQKNFTLALIFLKLRALIHPELFKTYEHWKQIYRDQTSKGSP
ncbi:MAG: polynucleotide adenylyltransferase PcnB [Chlamydiales bacterium]